MDYLGESGTLSDLLNSFHQWTEIDGRDGRVTDQFNEIFDDHDSTTLDFHAPIVESTEQEGNHDCQSGGLDLRNESRI